MYDEGYQDLEPSPNIEEVYNMVMNDVNYKHLEHLSKKRDEDYECLLKEKDDEIKKLKNQIQQPELIHSTLSTPISKLQIHSTPINNIESPSDSSFHSPERLVSSTSTSQDIEK